MPSCSGSEQGKDIVRTAHRKQCPATLKDELVWNRTENTKKATTQSWRSGASVSIRPS